MSASKKIFVVNGADNTPWPKLRAQEVCLPAGLLAILGTKSLGG